MKVTAARIHRRIIRLKIQLNKLLEREEHLSKYGHWEIGYLKGQISVLEDWLDECMMIEGIEIEDEE